MPEHPTVVFVGAPQPLTIAEVKGIGAIVSLMPDSLPMNLELQLACQSQPAQSEFRSQLAVEAQARALRYEWPADQKK